MPEKEIKTSEIERRGFLQSVLAVAAIPPLCCTTQALPGVSVSFGPDSIKVDLTRVPELRRTGAAFSVFEEQRKINLILIHVEHGRYVAMDRTCTHGGAMCTYNSRRHTLQCTSLNHAEYDMHGTLLHGRTHGNLKAYETTINGSTVEIHLERKA